MDPKQTIDPNSPQVFGPEQSFAQDSESAFASAQTSGSEKLRQALDRVRHLAEAIEKKDRYTGGHNKRVFHYSSLICRQLDLSAEETEKICLGALLHDFGKIGIEDHILKKQAPLDAEEWKVMMRHPDLGHEILKTEHELMEGVIQGMLYHHERWDGRGYPHGLQGENIPFIARVIAVADAYDAMVSSRPYRKGIGLQAAYDEIVQHSGTQFDPQVVEAFVQAFGPAHPDLKTS